MAKKDIYGKEVKTLPCRDGCGTIVPVGDDAVAVRCSMCTQRKLMEYERGDDEDGGDENMTLEELNEGRKSSAASKARRDSVSEGRGKVRGSKRPKKHPVKRGKKAAGRKAARPVH